MPLLDAVVVLGLVGLICYGSIRLLTRATQQQRRPLPRGGTWNVVHYDVKGETRVVLQKVSPGGANILDEHVVALIRIDDPEYDAKFLAATATARERRSVFESEEDS